MALMSFWWVANQSFASDAVKQVLPLGVRMLAAKAACTAFLSADQRVVRISLALLDQKSHFTNTLRFGQRGRLGFAFAGRLGPEKLPILLPWIEPALVEFRPPLRALYLVNSGLSLLCCETARSYVWTIVVVTLVSFGRSNSKTSLQFL